MAKKASITEVTNTFDNTPTINANFTAINDKLGNTLSLDGSTPNSMSADLDMGGKDILNAGSVSVTSLTVNGVPSTQDSAVEAQTAASEAEASRLAAEVAQAAAEAAENSLLEWQGPWVTSTAYDQSDIVSESGTSYVCIVAHTSGTFSTDLSASKWEVFAQKGSAGAGTGDMLAANNLSDVVDVAASRANLGIGTNGQLNFVDLINTNAEWEAGTISDYGYITPAQLKAAILAQVSATLSPDFTTTVAWGSVVTSASHGLGSLPSRWRVTLICTATDLGYAVGDVVDVTALNEGSGARGNTSSANSTAIQLAGSSIYATPKAGGSVSPMNTAKWNVKFEAWV